MGSLVGFALGFVTGWAARSTVESSRAAAIGLASAAMAFAERVKRAVAIEGDYLEDFVAEVRSRVQDSRPWRDVAGNANGTVAAGSAGDGGVP
jgi:hypothetical protein